MPTDDLPPPPEQTPPEQTPPSYPPPPPPPSSLPPVPWPTPAVGNRRPMTPERRQFLIGLGIGAIPVVLAMLGLGSLFNGISSLGDSFTLLGILGIAYLLMLITALALLFARKTRKVAQGMVTALLVGFVVFFIACSVVLNTPHG